MKKSLFTYIILLLTSFLFAQEITFMNKIELLDHPEMPIAGLGFPFIPLDYNHDGNTDFAGSSFSEQIYYKGDGNGTFEEIVLTWSQQPIKVIDWDNDGDQDVIFEQHVRITENNDEFRLVNLQLQLSEIVSDAADINNDSYTDFVSINQIVM